MQIPTIDIPAEVLNCCSKPDILNMDRFDYSPADWNNPKPRINRVCLKCFTHWVGRPNRVRKYTRANWDEVLSSGEKNNQRLRQLLRIEEGARNLLQSWESIGADTDGAYKALHKEFPDIKPISDAEVTAYYEAQQSPEQPNLAEVDV